MKFDHVELGILHRMYPVFCPLNNRHWHGLLLTYFCWLFCIQLLPKQTSLLLNYTAISPGPLLGPASCQAALVKEWGKTALFWGSWNSFEWEQNWSNTTHVRDNHSGKTYLGSDRNKCSV